MEIREVKEILVKKFEDENSCFTEADINVEKTENGFKVVINEYEHITFEIVEEQDEVFGYNVWVYETWFEEEKKIIAWTDSKNGYDYKGALLQLGYHISNTF